MDSGYYAAAAALLAQSQALDLAAHNLSNVNTPGYKAQRPLFQSLLQARGIAAQNPVNSAINNYGVIGGSALNLASGVWERTANDLDLAIEGDGYFTIQDKAGVRHTRNGNFRLAADGTLVTGDGDPVLGPGGPIHLLPGTTTVSTDGTISVDGAVMSKLQLVEFPAGTTLTAEGATRYIAPAGAAHAASNSQVRQGVLENSNVNAVASAVELVVVQRQAEMLQRALTIFHTEFNRTAAEDLPRV